MLSVPIIIRNGVKLNYPLDRVVMSVVGLADEVVIAADPTSEDDTLDYVHDLAHEVNLGTADHGTTVRWFESVWDLNNISSTGAEFARQTNIAFDECKGDWLLSLQADEAMHEEDHGVIKALMDETGDLYDAFAMTRVYFYGDMDTVRTDWTVPIIRLFRAGTRRSCEDAMNTAGTDRVASCSVPIYHYSRIGDPEIISKRILSLDSLFHDKGKLLKEEELKPYDFNTRNFDCMHKDTVDVGKREVRGEFELFVGEHPAPFVDYTGVV